MKIIILILLSFSKLWACNCSQEANPVCGSNNRGYINACVAKCAGVSYTQGSCPDDPDGQFVSDDKTGKNQVMMIANPRERNNRGEIVLKEVIPEEPTLSAELRDEYGRRIYRGRSGGVVSGVRGSTVPKEGTSKEATLSGEPYIPNQGCACKNSGDPVCGPNNKGYANACVAKCAGVTSYTLGSCPDDPDGQFVSANNTVKNCVCHNTVDPVCGSNKKTYQNYCFAKCDKVNDYIIGSCPNDPYVGNPQQGFNTNNPAQITTLEPGTNLSQTGYKAPENDEVSQEDQVEKITRKKQDIKKSNALMSNIALLGIGVLTPVFVQECYNVPSAWIGGASAALYIANEIGLISKYKEGSKRNLEAFKNLPNAQQKQILSLQKAARETDVAAKAAGTKAKFANLAKTGFMMASAAAIAEGVLQAFGINFICNGAKPQGAEVDVEGNIEADLPENCVSSKGSVTNRGGGDVETGSGEDAEMRLSTIVVKPLSACSSRLDLELHKGPASIFNEKKLHATSSQNQNDLNSFFQFIEYKRFGLQSETKQSPTLKEYNRVKELNILNFGGKLKELFDVFIPSANAFNPAAIASLGLGATAGTELMKYTGGLSGILKQAVMMPASRAAIFGGFSLLTGTAANDMKEAEEGYKHRAGQYRDLASELQEKTKITGFNPGDIDLGGLNLQRQCFQGDRLELEVDPTCECLKDKTCKNPQFPDISKVDGLKNIDLLKNGTRDLQGIAQGVYQGTLSENDPRINSVLGKTEELATLRSDLLEKMNKQRKENGFIDYPLEEAERISANTMGQQVQDAYQKLSPSFQRQIASRLGRSPSDFGGTLSEVKSDLEKENTISRPKREARLNSSSSSTQAASQSPEAKDDFSLEFAFDDRGAPQENLEAQTTTNQDFSNVRDDIQPREGDSIFDTLHKRYQKEFNE